MSMPVPRRSSVPSPPGAGVADPERELIIMPVAGVAGKTEVENAWWCGGQRRSHRQHERAQAWPLYRGSHRAAASALRADQDGAGYPRRAQRTALEGTEAYRF